MKTLLLALLVLLVGCGAQDSSGSSAPVAATRTIKGDITALHPVYGDFYGMQTTTFEAEYSDLAEVAEKDLWSVVILLDASYGIVPPKCTADYIFKYTKSEWTLTRGKKYYYRACLYDVVRNEFSPGYAGEIVAE